MLFAGFLGNDHVEFASVNTLYGVFDRLLIADILVDEYGIDYAIAARDAQAWVDKLKACGLV